MTVMATALDLERDDVELLEHDPEVYHGILPAYRDPTPGSLPEGVAVRSYPERSNQEVDPLGSSCKYCKSPPTQPCMVIRGKKAGEPSSVFHKARIIRARIDRDADAVRIMPSYHSGTAWYITGGTATTTAGQGGFIRMTPAWEHGTTTWSKWVTIYQEQHLAQPTYYGGTEITNGWNSAQVWYDWSSAGTVASTGYTPTWTAEEWNRMAVTTLRDEVRVQNQRLAALNQRDRDALRVSAQELRERQQAQREENSRARLANTRRYDTAQERALDLLDIILTDEEKASWDASDHHHILVRAASGQLYKVITVNSVHGNIYMTDEHGCMLASLCVAPAMGHRSERDGNHYGLPLADGWVGQILYIKHDEEKLLKTANMSRRSQCKQPNVPILGQRAA